MNINSHQFFDLLNEVDSSYLAAAHKSMTAKPARMWFRPALIAACLTLILVAIPVGILIGNRTGRPTVPMIDPTITSTSETPITTTPPETTEAPKASVLDIPGAVLLDENDNRFYNSDDSFSSGTNLFSEERTREMLKHMKENNSIVIGFIQDYTTVLVEDGKDYYQITSMTIQVLENVSGIEEKTITAVYACRYYNDYGRYMPAGTYRVSDSIWSVCNQFIQARLGTEAYVANQGNCAGFILLKESQDQQLLIGNFSFNLSDYADYVLDACLQWVYYGSLYLHLGASYYPIPSSFVEEAFNKPFTNTYPCPYEYPFSYPLVETPKDGDFAANNPKAPTS